MTVAQIDGWGPPLPKFERKVDPEYRQLGEMLTSECYSALCARTGDALVEAMGIAVMHRSQTLSPP